MVVSNYLHFVDKKRNKEIEEISKGGTVMELEFESRQS